MYILGDYHTHTTYSHGKNSVLENALIAKKKGLKEIAITDHGINHKFFAVKKYELEKLRQDCNEAEKLTGIKIYLGLECNFISYDGDIDVDKDVLKYLDIFLVGYHKLVKAKTKKEEISLFLRNNISKIFPVSKSQIEKNTNMYINAMKKYNINIITHLNHSMKVDVMKVALEAKKHNILIELNGKRICFSDKEMLDMANAGVKFIINSDAHSCNKVGEVNNAINLVTRLNIPHDLVVNLDKLPKFKGNENELIQ